MMGLTVLATALKLVERGHVPDALVRSGIRAVVRSGLRSRARGGIASREKHSRDLLDQMRSGPIAVHTGTANQQHYELPAEFFGRVLGPHLKYSGCYWPPGVESLEHAESASLSETCRHAALADGQDILELGCGWGSLTMWMAKHYPESRITAVSNSHSQRRFIEAQCAKRGLGNVTVITADMGDFAAADRFDRVVSVEMFEHMRNHEELMRRIAGWLKPNGKCFVHIFVHRRATYLYETRGAANWMGRYFFTGGVMPADDLLVQHQRDLLLQKKWRQSGEHYRKTADAWLRNLDDHREEVLNIFDRVYGPRDKHRWLQRWRMFFMACAETFGYANGGEWWVSHYLFTKRS